jgi:GGDEF domain-containing protein
LSLIMMDLDYFKKINDTYGHPVGDQALVFLARVLREVSGDDGLPIRYAGDEFMILLPRSGKRSAVNGRSPSEQLHSEPCPSARKEAQLGSRSASGLLPPEDAQTGRAWSRRRIRPSITPKAGADRLANAGHSAEDIFTPRPPCIAAGENTGREERRVGRVSQYLQSFSQGRVTSSWWRWFGYGQDHLPGDHRRNLAKDKTSAEPRSAGYSRCSVPITGQNSWWSC